MLAPRPRDAATLILVRQDGNEPRILMGRRSDGHAFMPDKWVFPGGRIDRVDYRASVVRELDPAVSSDLAATARLKRQDGERLARAIAVAAVRETFEETGLVLGRLTDGRLQPDLGHLSYVARAITPPARSRRFDARFLMADAEQLQSLDPRDSRELPEVGWFSLNQCSELDLPIVTRAVLDVVGQTLRGEEPQRPFWRWTKDRSSLAI